MIAPLRRTLAALVLLGWSGAFAAPGATASREIEHLLSFVASSECRFVRGGTEHPGREARDHLLRKLEVARPLLGTADQFIDHVATGSSLTGEAYKVRCGTRELTSKEWLRTELERYRKSVKAP
jgi:hypothetical protein